MIKVQEKINYLKWVDQNFCFTFLTVNEGLYIDYLNLYCGLVDNKKSYWNQYCLLYSLVT